MKATAAIIIVSSCGFHAAAEILLVKIIHQDIPTIGPIEVQEENFFPQITKDMIITNTYVGFDETPILLLEKKNDSPVMFKPWLTNSLPNVRLVANSGFV